MGVGDFSVEAIKRGLFCAWERTLERGPAVVRKAPINQ